VESNVDDASNGAFAADTSAYAKSYRAALERHWPEYLIEACGLGFFMVSACLFAALIEYPGSPVRARVDSDLARRLLGGLAMGATAFTIFYSRWGKRSGAHIHPVVTLVFLRLGKVDPRDAVFYIVAQFAGALAGVLASAAILGSAIAHPSINFVLTSPGPSGVGIAFMAEVAISFGMMATVLTVSNSRFARFTGLCASVLVAIYITFEAPLSGMSMNPARSLGSAVPAAELKYLWVYFTAPLVGMFAAARAYLLLRGRPRVACAKIHHANPQRCIFCEFQASRAER